MSKYTTNFYSLTNMGVYTKDEIKSWFTDYELSDYLTPEEIAVIGSRGTWSKERLAEKIYNHFFMKDIGFETPMLFQHWAKITMQEIMENKLPLIYSASIKYDPLVNIDLTETYSGTGTGTSNATGLNVNSDTPQGQISKSAILSGSYASNTSATEGEQTNNTSESYTKHTKGNEGIYITNQRLIKEYRDNIRAIDYEIITELKSLFIGLL